MDLFKKKKEQIEMPQAEPPKADVRPAEKPVPPDSEQLAEAKRRAEEQIQNIERRIAAEREAWASKIKEKEEEGISLKARLDMLMRQSEKEREKQDSKMNLLQQQVQRDLGEVEKMLEAELKNWTERLSQKDQELEDAKHEAIFRETQNKIETEQHLRSLQLSLEEAEQKSKNLERQLLEEQNQWIARIKNKEEEILNLKTQISLRESQLSMEEEKGQRAQKEMEAAWQNQIKELEARSKTQQEDWARTYQTKEEDLYALRSALEQRLTSVKLDMEQKEKDLLGAQARVEEKMKSIEHQLAADRARWEEILKAREEEFKQLKADLILRESQEKTDREMKQQELKEAETAATRQLKDIRQKIEEEKGLWQGRITSKEEEIKVFTIQAELKLKDIRDLQEKRKLQVEEERKVLGHRLAELKARLNDEKARGQQELDAKNAEILAYQQECQEKQNANLAADEQALAGLKEQTEALENELRTVGAALEQEKTRWHELLTGKERELTALKFEAAGKETQAQQALEAFTAQLSKEVQPLLDQIKSLENRIDESLQQKQAEIARKDVQKRSLDEQYKKQEEIQRARFAAQADKLKAAQKIAEDRAAQVRAQMELQTKQNTEAMERLTRDESALRDKLAHVNETVSQEKEKLAAQNGASKEQLTAKIQALEQEYAAIREQTRKEIADKAQEIEQTRTRCAESEAVLQKELDARTQELTDLRAKAEQELRTLIQAQQKEKEEHYEAVKRQEDRIASLEKTLRDNEARLVQEAAVFQDELVRSLVPLEKRLAELDQLIAHEKEDGQKRIASLGEEGRGRVEQSNRLQEDFRQRLAAVIESINTGSQNYTKNIAELRAAQESQDAQADETLLKLNQKEEILRQNLAADEQKAAAEQARIKQYYQTQSAQLTEAVQRLEKEYQLLTQKTEGEIQTLSRELAETERTCAERETAARTELEAKEQELAALENQGAKEVAAQQEEIARLKEDYARKIFEKEQAIASLQQASKDGRERAQEDMETLRTSFEKELQPLSLRRQEMKAELVRVKKDTDEQIALLRQKREELQQALAAKETQLVADRKAWTEKIGAMRNELAQKIQALGEERARAEAEAERALIEKTEEYKRLENEIVSRKESSEQQKEAVRREGEQFSARLREEIDTLFKEKSTIERELPGKIAAQQEMIDALEKQIVQRAAMFQQQHEQAERSAENYQRRTERRILQARTQLEQLKERSQAELQAAENRFAVLREEAEKKEAVQQEELTREGKVFAEEKYRLEKQKTELEEQLKDLQMQSREQLRQKEKEILAHQAELTEKEKAWELAWQQKEEELAAEKNTLIHEIEALETKIKEEKDIAERRLAEKAGETADYQAQHELRLQNMAAEFGARKSSWDETNARLAEQVKALAQEMDTIQKNWDESRAAREKELSVLKSNLEFWELRAKTEEEKRLAAWEDERLALEQKIKETGEKLETVQKEYTLELEEKDRAFQKLRGEVYAGEEAQTKQWKEAEAGFAEKKNALLAEIETWEKKVREESAAADKQCKDLDREIERLKLESALRDTATLTEQQKSERKWRKLQRDLDDKLDALKRDLAEEKEGWLGKLHVKEEEIKTLHVRLTLREERRTAEIARRREEVAKVLASLDEELQLLKQKYGTLQSAASDIAAREETLASLKRETEEKETRWNEEKARREAAAAQAKSTLEVDLENMEDELKQESRRLEQLFVIKEKQIENLVSHMAAKETDLSSEREQTRRVLEALRRKADEFRFVLAQRYGAKDAVQGREIRSLFNEAIELYGAGEYLKAQETLEKFLETKPDFAGAYQYLSLCHFNLNNRPQSLKMARRAYELEPHNEELKSWIETLTRENINE